MENYTDVLRLIYPSPLDIRNGTCHTRYAKRSKRCSGAKLSESLISRQLCCCSARRNAGWYYPVEKSCHQCPNVDSCEYLTPLNFGPPLILEDQHQRGPIISSIIRGGPKLKGGGNCIKVYQN